MNIIELTGPPCSGKSSALPLAMKNYKAALIDSKWIDAQLHCEYIPIWLRLIFREIYLTCRGIYILRTRRLTGLIVAVLRSGWRWQRIINVLRNVIQRYSIHELAAKSTTQILLMDEGLLHLPYIFATSKSGCPLELLSFFPFGKPSAICFRADHSTLLSRLRVRGHSMIASDAELEILSKFVSENLAAQALQEKYLTENKIQILPLI